jgi:hypothetical protein
MRAGADGVLHVVPGYVRVTAPALPIPADAQGPARHAVMAEPGAPMPPEAIVVLIWGFLPWRIQDVVAIYPALAALVLDQEYQRPDGTRGRCKVAEAPPVGAVVVGTNLIPVLFAGEEIS